MMQKCSMLFLPHSSTSQLSGSTSFLISRSSQVNPKVEEVSWLSRPEVRRKQQGNQIQLFLKSSQIISSRQISLNKELREQICWLLSRDLSSQFQCKTYQGLLVNLEVYLHFSQALARSFSLGTTRDTRPLQRLSVSLKHLLSRSRSQTLISAV